MPVSNSSRIAYNTIALYGRSLIVLAVSLFTSRVILNALGVEDYGINNVIGGVIGMLSFLNSTMSATYQRYFNVAMGEGNEQDIKKLFRTSLSIQLLMTVIVVALGETVGLWFLNNKLVIPESRMDAAQILYQVTIVSFILALFKSPFAALITAYEKMSVYAVFSIIESVLRLGIAYIVFVFSGDKLIVYSFLCLFVSVVDFLLYVVFCVKRIETTDVGFCWEKKQLVNMTSFSGWSVIGTLAYTLKSQGINIVLNLFFGPVVNAARGVASQVMNAVNQFIHSFQTSFRPQLTKSYASGDYDYTMKLYYGATKLSYYLLFTLALPILLETDQILHLWLGKSVPEYAAVFTRIILLTSFVSAFANPTTAIAYATGKIKNFSIIVSVFNLLIVPVAYVFLKLGFGPTSSMVVSLVITIIVQVIRLFVVASMTELKVSDYFRKVVLPVVVYSILTMVLPIALMYFIPQGWIRLVAVIFSSFISSIIVVWLVGLSSMEKQFVISKIKHLSRRNSKNKK